MKKLILIFLTLIFSLCFVSCKNEEIELENPVKLYYCTDKISFNNTNGVVDFELREFKGWENNPRDFLNKYLSGPKSTTLKSPFPLGAWILELNNERDWVKLLLNTHFSRLSPHELSQSCVCISMTLFELFDVDTVYIEIDGTSTDRTRITMTRENIHLYNSSQVD